MRLGVSLPNHLVEFADREAERRGTSRSGLLAQLLAAEQVRSQARSYIDQHGWDVAEDETAWGNYQRERMSADYGDDDW